MLLGGSNQNNYFIQISHMLSSLIIFILFHFNLVCSYSADEVSQDETLDHIDEQKFEASTECIVCEYAMKELEKQLGKNATEVC